MEEPKIIAIDRYDARIVQAEKWAEKYSKYEMISLTLAILKKNHLEAYCLTKYLLDELEATTNRNIKNKTRICINDFHEQIEKKKLEGEPENCIDFVMRKYPNLHLTDDSEKLLDPLRTVIDGDVASFKEDFKTISDFVISIRHHNTSTVMSFIAIIISLLALMASGIVPFLVPPN